MALCTALCNKNLKNNSVLVLGGGNSKIEGENINTLDQSVTHKSVVQIYSVTKWCWIYDLLAFVPMKGGGQAR